MAASPLYLPRYNESDALVVWIDKYQNVGPLLHACHDATDVAQTLIDEFGFQKSNVQLLLNERATRHAILNHYLCFCERTEADDRVVIFFAGHGHTVTGRSVREAKAQGDKWGPSRAGLFRGSAQRFSDIADAYGQVLSRVNWW
jgi:hypothetical protein